MITEWELLYLLKDGHFIYGKNNKWALERLFEESPSEIFRTIAINLDYFERHKVKYHFEYRPEIKELLNASRTG